MARIAKETKEISLSLNIEDCNITVQDRKQYKKILVAACHSNNENMAVFW